MKKIGCPLCGTFMSFYGITSAQVIHKKFDCDTYVCEKCGATLTIFPKEYFDILNNTFKNNKEKTT